MRSQSGDFEAAMQAGVRASQSGDPDAALVAFTEALRLQPANALAHFLAGSELAGRGSIEQAELELLTSVVLSPAFQLARYQLGLLQYSSGRAALALGTWAPLTDSDPHSHLASFVRGFSALAADDFAGARREFEKGLALNHDNPAMSQDIRQLLDRMPGTQPAVPEPAAHVLVSNYARYGNLH